MSRAEVVEALIAERYGPAPWWESPTPSPRPTDAPDLDDSEATCARRRRHMAADFDRSYREDTA